MHDHVTSDDIRVDAFRCRPSTNDDNMMLDREMLPLSVS